MRDGGALKLDRTGKSILMVLRHLGRLQEVRAARQDVELPHGRVLEYRV